MFCPVCKYEYKEGYTRCKDCNVTLVLELPPEPKHDGDYNIVKLYSPRNLTEQSLIQSILDSEGINYYIHNDFFGSLEVGPQIDLYNKKMIMVPNDQYERAKELLDTFLESTEDKDDLPGTKYSISDKIRMIIEFLLFGWMMPGRKNKNKGEE